MAYLVLVRHGESAWNAKGLWTGWTDISLDPLGRIEAQKTARLLTNFKFGAIFCSPLARCRETLDEMAGILKLDTSQTVFADELKERNYGDFTAKNKWDVQKQVGEDEFEKIRRSWDYQIPNGESLKQVYERAVPFYIGNVEPALKEGKNVLIVAHGNSIRALLKFLEDIPDNEITHVEVGIAQAIIFTMSSNGEVMGKEIRGGTPDVAKDKHN